MFDAAVRHPKLLGSRSAETWRAEQRILDLQAELDRTRKDLEVLRATTAEMLTAILAKLHARPDPVATAATAIQKLADLDLPLPTEGEADPITGEIEKIDVSNRESLAYLDRRFRWLPARGPHS